MNQYIVDKGGRTLGDINLLLYRVAQGSQLPGFRDITAGGHAVDTPVQGYDMVSGLGSPNVYNLARNLLDAQKADAHVATGNIGLHQCLGGIATINAMAERLRLFKRLAGLTPGRYRRLFQRVAALPGPTEFH